VCLFAVTFLSVLSVLLVPTFENVFDDMYKAHSSLGHPKDFRKNKNELFNLLLHTGAMYQHFS
jgi:hypothetical protein